MQVQPIAARVTALENVFLERVAEVSARAAHPLPPEAAPLKPPSPQDVTDPLFSEIAAPDIPRLSTLLEPHLSSEIAAHVTDLTHDATVALAQGDRSRALTDLQEIAAVDPQTLAVLAPEQALRPIRPQIDHLMHRLTTVAKMDAEGWLAQADEALEAPGHPSQLPNWQTRPETLLHVAHRLFDSGGYSNYVRSSGLAQTVLNSPLAYSPFIEQYAESLAPRPASSSLRVPKHELPSKKPLLATVAKTWAALRSTSAPRLQTLWRRAPLLVLFSGWLGAGLVAGPVSMLLRAGWPESGAASLIHLGFEVWALGFLALVGFGFYARVRDLR